MKNLPPPHSSAVLILAALCLTGFPAAAETFDRTILPIPEPDYPRSTVLDARDAQAPPRFEIKAPAGAPRSIKSPRTIQKNNKPR